MSKRNLNPDANKDSFFQPSASDMHCCGIDLQKCESTAEGTLAEAAELTGVQLVGHDLFVVDPTAVTAEEIQAAIIAALEAAGYHRINDVVVAIVDGVLTVSHEGEGHIESLIFGEETIDAALLCDAKYVCDYQVDAAGLIALSYEGVDYEVGEFVPGTDAPADVLAALEAAIAANPELAFMENPTVELNAAGDAYTIQYTSDQPQCGTVLVGERVFTPCLCETRYFTTEEEEKVKEKIEAEVQKRVAAAQKVAAVKPAKKKAEDTSK